MQDQWARIRAAVALQPEISGSRERREAVAASFDEVPAAFVRNERFDVFTAAASTK